MVIAGSLVSWLAPCISSHPAVAVEPPPKGPPTGAKAVTAGALYRRYCQSCHAADGRGERQRDGFDAPPDFTRGAWQEERSDAQLLESILAGKGTRMPAFGDRLREAQANALVGHIRSFSSVRAGPASTSQEFEDKFKNLREEFESLHKQMKELNASAPERGRGPARPADRQVADAPADANDWETRMRRLEDQVNYLRYRLDKFSKPVRKPR
jgi:mono/diheme cytochrome c family protein